MASLVAPGGEIERAAGGGRVPRHHHLRPYAALVLGGGYVEAGDRGRVRASAGSVLFHEAFEGHQDVFGRSGAVILNLPLPIGLAFAHGRVSDPDRIVRFAERDSASAVAELLDQAEPATLRPLDWPDQLALFLGSGRRCGIGDWARRRGLAPSSVSRGFRLAYGISPKRFSLECRSARAARRIRAGEPLSHIAAETGFADQAHMSRAVRGTFGTNPGTLRH